MKLIVLFCWVLVTTAYAQAPSAVSFPNCGRITEQDYTSWVMFPQMKPLMGLKQLGFGGPGIYDPAAGLWRCYLHDITDKTVAMGLSTNGMDWGQYATVLASSGAGWDSTEVGVPFAWYEDGAARPWRMLYRGKGTSYAIGLATSTDGITWDRKDTAGTDLTSAVITNAADIDFGNVFWYGTNYWCYYNTTAPSARKLFLATSTDLTNWVSVGGMATPTVFFEGRTNASGAWDYDDSTHTAVGTNLTRGYFCPWVGRCDKLDGTLQFLMYVVTYSTNSGANGVLDRIVAFTSQSPYFYATNRTFRGIIYDTSVTKTYQAIKEINVDVPRVQCADITQNITAGADRMFVSRELENYSTGPYWGQGIMTRPAAAVSTEGAATNGWSLQSMDCLLPSSNPGIHLAIATNLTNIFIAQPAVSSSMLDLSGYGFNPVYSSGYSQLTMNGIKLTYASNSFWKMWQGGTNGIPSQWLTITQDMTVEWSCAKASVVGAAAFRVLCQSRGLVSHDLLYVYLTGSAGDTAVTWSIRITDSTGTQRLHNSPSFNWASGELRTFAFSISGGKIYDFNNGTLLNAGGTAFNYVLESQAGRNNFPFNLGADITAATLFWEGEIGNFQVANVGLYTANYTPSPWPISYSTTGYAFSPVIDKTTPATSALTFAASIPAGCAVTTLYRNPSSIADKSITPGDFSIVNGYGRYHQFALQLTGTGTNTPNVNAILIK